MIISIRFEFFGLYRLCAYGCPSRGRENPEEREHKFSNKTGIYRLRLKVPVFQIWKIIKINIFRLILY